MDLVVWLLSGLNQSESGSEFGEIWPHQCPSHFCDFCGLWWCPIPVVFPLGPPNLRCFWSPAAVADGHMGECPFKKGSVAGGSPKPSFLPF